MAHLGRSNSIDALLPRDRTSIVGIFEDRRDFERSAQTDAVYKGSGLPQRSYVEWMDFVKILDTGEVLANDALRQQRSNPTQRRLIPLKRD